mmetsp:Transcript_10304/g.24067  ORF Transcript_10304/g.24067 Transcript_10304/m.24067 type:complete len:442 (-) Transcript_10304:1053-2378(-)
MPSGLRPVGPKQPTTHKCTNTDTYTHAQRKLHPPPSRLPVSYALQSLRNAYQDALILDRSRHLVRLTVGNLPHGAPQDLATPRLGQPLHHQRVLQARDRAHPLPHELHHLPPHPLRPRIPALPRGFGRLGGLEEQHGDRHLAFQLVLGCDNGAFHHLGVEGARLLEQPRAQPVTGHVHNVIRSRHDMHIPIRILEPAVPRMVVAWEARKVRVNKALVVVVNSRHETRGEGQPHGNLPHPVLPPPGGLLLPGRGVEHPHVVARHREAARPRHGADVVHLHPAHGPPALCLPIVVHYRHPKEPVEMLHRLRVRPLPRHKQRAQAREVHPPQQLPAGVGAADRPERCGGCEHASDLVLLDDAPVLAGVGRAHGLALVQHRGAPGEEGAVGYIAVPHCPPDITGAEVCLPRPGAHQRRHAPAERHPPRLVPQDPLGLPRGPRGVD